jgi:hypothetical protein
MKKLGLLLMVMFIGLMVEAQVTLPKMPASKDMEGMAMKNFIAPPPIGDVGKTTDGIVGKLISSLALGADKKPGLTSAIGGFLKDKQGFIGLAKSAPAEYLSKFNPLQKGLFGKLKSTMGAAAFTKFMGLKPAGGDATNVLSNLFF